MFSLDQQSMHLFHMNVAKICSHMWYILVYSNLLHASISGAAGLGFYWMLRKKQRLIGSVRPTVEEILLSWQEMTIYLNMQNRS